MFSVYRVDLDRKSSDFLCPEAPLTPLSMDLILLIGIAVALLAIILTALFFGRRQSPTEAPGV